MYESRLDTFEWYRGAGRVFQWSSMRIGNAVIVDGLSRRKAAKRFGVHGSTISKMLRFSALPGYRHRE
jgi:hypothetical protein